MSGIVIKYIPLLSLSVEQLFYQNKIGRTDNLETQTDLVIKPTAESNLVMNRLGFVFKVTNMTGGFVLLAPVLGKNASGNYLLKTQERKNDQLSFLLFLKNPEMLNFNDLPNAPQDDKIYYFNNQITDPAALRDDLHLTQDASGVNGVSDTMKMSFSNYLFQYTTVVAPNTAKVRHILTGAEINPKLLTTIAGRTELTFDLSPLPSGKCRLIISNAVKEEFYYVKDETSRKIFGVIELSLSNSLPVNYRLLESDHSISTPKPVYKIRFVNRKTLWRYTIRVPVNNPLYLEISGLNPADKIDFMNRLNIQSNDPNIAFTLSGSTDTQFVFVTNMPQALQEKYYASSSTSHDVLSMTLKKYIGIASRETNVRSDLPLPDTRNTDASNYPIVISNIFITL